MPFLGRQLTNGEALSLLSYVGFSYGHGLIYAACVMGAESARYVGAYYQNVDEEGNVLSTDRGLFQINDKAHPSLSDADAYHPIRNAEYAYELSQQGRDFTPWAVWNHKTYLRYLPQVVYFYTVGTGWRRRIPRIPELFP